MAEEETPTVTPDAPQSVSFTKRDQLEVEEVVGKPLGALFAVHDGETYPKGEFMLAATYVVTKKAGLTDLGYDEWLDTPSEEFEVNAKVDPT